ncbi:MAG: bifunctional folylpolyglutamate synthase/dihydrofolate synthase, partial [Anaerolineales bacterium]|nr:bifunctional folylpolyglutamate synthase/dihydrofolate synthase [Anaerolineales bacterium]
LLGRHQLENAASAVATLHVLRKRGFAITPQAVHEGLSQVRWPGRLEILSRDPLVVIDCAHNPYSAQVLTQALSEWFPGRRWVLVFGASSDKDIPGMLEALLPLSEYVIVTRSEHPRSTGPVVLADTVARVGGGAEIAVNVRKALHRGLDLVRGDNGLLVTGSIFLVAEAREAWALENGTPPPDNDGDPDG